MWDWILLGAAIVCGGTALRLRRVANKPTETQGTRRGFIVRLAEEICASGEEYGVRGMVSGTMTMVVVVRGQEVPVPLDRVHHHFLSFPDQFGQHVRQLLTDIEEMALEDPQDHSFADSALRILPQICSKDWIYSHGPAFGDSAIVHRDLGPDLAVCYVIDEDWSLVYLCQAHLRMWNKTETDVFHLANQNLRRKSGADLPDPEALGGPVRVSSGDGYDAARVLLLDPDRIQDLLVGVPRRDALFLARREDGQSLVDLMAEEGGSHPVSGEVYAVEDQKLVPVSGPFPR